jgi:hypothetical protein
MFHSTNVARTIVATTRLLGPQRCHHERHDLFPLWPLAGRLVVTLTGMSDIMHVVLIHGMCGRANYLAPARAAFEERGK